MRTRTKPRSANTGKSGKVGSDIVQRARSTIEASRRGMGERREAWLVLRANLYTEYGGSWHKGDGHNGGCTKSLCTMRHARVRSQSRQNTKNQHFLALFVRVCLQHTRRALAHACLATVPSVRELPPQKAVCELCLGFRYSCEYELASVGTLRRSGRQLTLVDRNNGKPSRKSTRSRGNRSS